MFDKRNENEESDNSSQYEDIENDLQNEVLED